MLQSEKAFERSLSSSEVLLFLASYANLAFLAFFFRRLFFRLCSRSTVFFFVQILIC
jgi:hypothetical protein